MSRRKVMVTLGGGGHLWESLSLVRQLAADYDLVFLTSHGSIVPKGAEFQSGNVFRISDVASITRHGVVSRTISVLRGVFESCSALKHARPDVVIGVGTALSVPLLLAARLMGIPAVFIESITRVDGLSQSGRIIRSLRLAKTIYVQWPDAAKPTARVVYEGTVL